VNEINVAHPFIDGNGRTQRSWLRMLTDNAGFELRLTDRDIKRWNDASARGFTASDHAPMAALLKERLKPRGAFTERRFWKGFLDPLTSHIDSMGLRCDFHCLVEMSGPMPETQTEQRRPPYATLRAASDGDAANVRANEPLPVADEVPNYLTAEADKLENLKQALYAAFVAAPKIGIPTALVDLAATYTNALRLQMTLRGYGTMPNKSAKTQKFPTGRGLKE
jgi:hypothetical protein